MLYFGHSPNRAVMVFSSACDRSTRREQVASLSEGGMNKLLFGSAMMLAAMAGAEAANIPKAAPPQWNWTGFYLGGDVGIGGASARNTFADPNDVAFS
jgi:hypothetical protein